MTIIQNLACIPLIVNPNDHRISFNIDALKDKKINTIHFFNGDFNDNGDLFMSSPYDNLLLSPTGPIGIEDYFMSLTDKQGNQFIKNFSFNKNFVSIADHNFDEIGIDRVLDLLNSFISYNISTAVGLRSYLLLVAYQTSNLQKFDDVVNGSITVEIPTTAEIQDICLKDVIPNALKGKHIKKIIPSYLRVPPASYLDLFCTDGKHIQNIPVTLLEIQDTKEFYFDNIEIDVEKSYFRQRGTITYTGTHFETIIEKPSITFIY